MDPQQRAASAQVRLEYCSKLFDMEQARTTSLDGKAQVYAGFITGFLALIFFSVDYVKILKTYIQAQKIPIEWRGALVLLIVLLGAAIVVNLWCVLNAQRIRNYREAYLPDSFVSLFVQHGGFFGAATSEEFLETLAKQYLGAVLQNHRLNNDKSRFLVICGYGLLIAAVLLMLLIALTTALQLTLNLSA